MKEFGVGHYLQTKEVHTKLWVQPRSQPECQTQDVPGFTMNSHVLQYESQFFIDYVMPNLQHVRSEHTCFAYWVDPAGPASQSRQWPLLWWRAAAHNPPLLFASLSSDYNRNTELKPHHITNHKFLGQIPDLRILLRVSLMWGNFSLNVSFMSFFRSDGLTYSMTVVCRKHQRRKSQGVAQE